LDTRKNLLGALVFVFAAVLALSALPVASGRPALGTPTPSPTATFTPTALTTPTLTSTATQTATPSFTLTQTPSPSPTLTPTSQYPPVTVKMQANCRYGPGVAYLYRWGLYPGDKADVRGRNWSATSVAVP